MRRILLARRARTTGTRRTRLAAGAILLATLSLGACSDDREDVTVGLITKQEENPYWVTMRHVAEQTARDEGVTLLTATGASDTDVTAQEAAIADMVERGADGILITPVDSTALLSAIESARDAGVVVIALHVACGKIEVLDHSRDKTSVLLADILSEVISQASDTVKSGGSDLELRVL